MSAYGPDPAASAQGAFADGPEGDPPGEGVAPPDADALDGGEGPLDRLFDGDAPGPAVPEIQRDYPLPKWACLMLRGCMRVMTGSGIPPIFEILLGGMLGVLSNRGGSGDGGGGDPDGGGLGGGSLDVHVPEGGGDTPPI